MAELKQYSVSRKGFFAFTYFRPDEKNLLPVLYDRFQKIYIFAPVIFYVVLLFSDVFRAAFLDVLLIPVVFWFYLNHLNKVRLHKMQLFFMETGKTPEQDKYYPFNTEISYLWDDEEKRRRYASTGFA